MCATSLFFFVGGRGSKRFRLFHPIWAFSCILRTALGLRKKNRALYHCFFVVPFISPWSQQRMATTSKIGRKQCKRTIYLISSYMSFALEYCVWMCILATSSKACEIACHTNAEKQRHTCSAKCIYVPYSTLVYRYALMQETSQTPSTPIAHHPLSNP